VTDQDYAAYSSEDHSTWAKLNRKQSNLIRENSSREYLDGFGKLNLDRSHVIKIGEVSERLEEICGWTLVPVTGLIPTKAFFYMLINKRYPVTVSIRKPWEIDFSEQPDIFHDVFGHLPLLASERFSKYLTAYSIIALRYINNERAVELLGRLYWFTYEMGVVLEDGELRSYGGAIITSEREAEQMRNPEIPKHMFDIRKIFQTPYNPNDLQREYFVIPSFDDLFQSVETLEEILIEHLLLPQRDLVLRNYSLNSNLGKSYNNVLGFLNDIQYQYPDSISFAAGQPEEAFFHADEQIRKFDLYVDHITAKSGKSRESTVDQLVQYSRTKGVINEIIAEYLRKDENIYVKPDNILVTVGAQEAFAAVVGTICNRDTDVILIEDPSYIGLSSFAKTLDYRIEAVRCNDEGVDLKQLRNKIIETDRAGKKVKLLYVIPDFQNPTGSYMPIGNRLKLLELAEQYNFLIIEDSVYNSFTYSQKRTPTLKSLDKLNRVIYVGSFSKSVFPGLRIGLLVADQKLENEVGEVCGLIDELAKVKALLTNSTPTVCQAILGGILLDLDHSLSEWNSPRLESYRKKRNKMVSALDTYIRDYQGEWSKDITWNEPDGGFFIKMNLPFEVGLDEVRDCARKYRVIICPMRFFYLNGGGEREIRLAFSNVDLPDIDEGVRRLACFLKSVSERAMVHHTKMAI